jgi:hypothetical protein
MITCSIGLPFYQRIARGLSSSVYVDAAAPSLMRVEQAQHMAVGS